MDYCSSCRRHLNGALACPGCGAYAPDIAPRAVVTPWRAPADSTWHDHMDETEEGAEATEVSYDGSPAGSAAPVGRAARRRQRARWKKTQRRALVATAVALVGGGLTVASLDRQSTDRAQAASAPDNTTMGVADEEATVPTPSASAPTGRHRAPDPTPSARSTATANAPQEQTAGTPRATPTPRRLTLTSVPSTASSAAQPQAAAAATVSGTITAPQSEPAATPTPTAGDSTPAPTASPAPTATSPSPSHSQLCLLVICIG
ncbi:SCO2400 family protein [Streptomyces sp. NPDC054813]